MGTEVLCPKPQRFHKQALADIYFNALPASKHARWTPLPSPTPSTYDQRSESLEDLDPPIAPPKKRRRLQSPSFKPTNDQHLRITRSDSTLPWPTCTPRSEHCRPQLLVSSLIDAWISVVSSPDPSPISPTSDRLSTCPATVDPNKAKRTPPSLATIKQMSQQVSQYGNNIGTGSGTGLDTSQNGRPGISHGLYRGILYNNYIGLDYIGRQMLDEVRIFANTQILKQRGSP